MTRPARADDPAGSTTTPTDPLTFEFGKNWRAFLGTIGESQIAAAQDTLTNMLGRESLSGRSFVDVGSGSGLFSLAARRLGATVHSFDVDGESVACTLELRRRYFEGDPLWTVEHGSALDSSYLGRLGAFDVVYSWGVLHHTGQMWRGLENVAGLVAPGGLLYIAIYNDQGPKSLRWMRVKRLYNRLPKILRFPANLLAFARLWGPTIMRDLFGGRGLETWRTYVTRRGMSPWHDAIDWIGGYPFEVARPEKIFDFYRDRDFTMQRLITKRGYGCNEFVFSLDRRPAAPAHGSL